DVEPNDDERAFASREERQSNERVYQTLDELLAGYMGQRFVDEFGMPWVKYVDKHGTEYALRYGQFEILPFPFVPVLQRAKGSSEFLYALHDIVQQQLHSNHYKVRDDASF